MVSRRLKGNTMEYVCVDDVRIKSTHKIFTSNGDVKIRRKIK